MRRCRIRCRHFFCFFTHNTPYSACVCVCCSSGHGSISVQDIFAFFFWLQFLVRGKKKVSHSFTTPHSSEHILLYLIVSFWFWLFVFAAAEFFSSCHRPPFFTIRSFECFGDSYFYSLVLADLASRMCNDAVDLFYWNGMRAAGTPSKALHIQNIQIYNFFALIFHQPIFRRVTAAAAAVVFGNLFWHSFFSIFFSAILWQDQTFE